MARAFLIVALYAFAFVMLYTGVEMAPAMGWPTNSSEMNGCAALILGSIAKTVAHCMLLRFF